MNSNNILTVAGPNLLIQNSLIEKIFFSSLNILSLVKLKIVTSQLFVRGVKIYDNLSLCIADLEKAASGASGACVHFVGNQAILRTF